MKKVFVLFIVLSFVSCKNTNNNTTTNEIIAFIIDKKAWPLPPPPPMDDTTTTEISKKMLDSLFKIKLKVAWHVIWFHHGCFEFEPIRLRFFWFQ